MGYQRSFEKVQAGPETQKPKPSAPLAAEIALEQALTLQRRAGGSGIAFDVLPPVSCRGQLEKRRVRAPHARTTNTYARMRYIHTCSATSSPTRSRSLGACRLVSMPAHAFLMPLVRSLMCGSAAACFCAVPHAVTMRQSHHLQLFHQPTSPPMTTSPANIS